MFGGSGVLSADDDSAVSDRLIKHLFGDNPDAGDTDAYASQDRLYTDTGGHSTAHGTAPKLVFRHDPYRLCTL